MRSLSVKICRFFLAPLSVWVIMGSCGTRESGIYLVELSPQSSGIHFSNNIIESDSLNYFNFPYIYMGGGIAIGDINNDGLSDIFFTGNMVENKLYLNKGNLTFEDISTASGNQGDNRWYTGVTMVDINADGWLDIYVCASGKTNSENQLFINNKDLTFSEKAETFGINDESPSIQSTFLDYDKDGDLDLFVGNYPLVPLSMGNRFYFEKMVMNQHESSGHLFKNNGDGSFSDITKQSGVQNFGLTLGVIAADFNNDGWQDIYVSNDFQVPDHLYMNNTDGTFSDVLMESFQHTSMFGMGIDASDFTNDGLIDLIQLDMAPEDYKRAKVNMASMDPKSFWEMVDLGGHYQYMQNCVQVNNGMNRNGIPVFSEISRLSGLATTDWSWGILLADLDNDGHKDLLITNGILRDINNNDVLNANKNSLTPQPIKMEEVPSQPLNNYIFQNLGDFKFKDVSDFSGFHREGYSNGIAYGDLDNDGDLDVVVSNLDAKALVFENKNDGSNNFISFRIKGSEENPFGIGTRVTIQDGNHVQMQELTLSRGFQSSVEPVIHFGLGKHDVIEQVRIRWPDGGIQTMKNVKSNQYLTIEKKENNHSQEIAEHRSGAKPQFLDITQKAGINFKHHEDQYDDFAYEPLLPHKNSQMGPGLAVGDIDNDGLEDFFIGNASMSAAEMFLQQQDTTFLKTDGPWQDDIEYEDTGALLFDPDNDGDLDLYIVSGGNDASKPASYYQDRLYINNQGKYIKGADVLPAIRNSGQVIISADFDLDGDKDLFIGGRIVPGRYPYPATSYILRNDGGRDENLRFTDVTKAIAPGFIDLGLVTSAIWEDFNNDGKPDLIIAGEWMGIRFFENKPDVFEEVKNIGMRETSGWWYSLKSVDVNGDGDKDIIAGNLGLNYKYQASKKDPFRIYANDFDENGKSDIVLSYTKKGKQLPVRGKECSSQQVPAISRRFKTYESFADADLLDIYGEYQLNNSLSYEAKTFAHYWIENDGTGKYVMHRLPGKSQFSSVNAIEIIDVNNDRFPDLLLGGNLYGSEVETPRNDASWGLVLENSGSGGFMAQSPGENGLMIKGEVRAIKSIELGKGGQIAYLFAINNDSLKLIGKKVILE